MSAWGQNRKSSTRVNVFRSPLKPDIAEYGRHVRFVQPRTDIDAPRPLTPAHKIGRKKPGCLAGLSHSLGGAVTFLEEHRGSCHLISHVVLCGISIAK